MVGATVLGVFLQGLPPDRRVAMARVASLIRRAARGVRESKRFGLVFYELNGGPLFGLESREKSLTLYIAEKSVIEPFVPTLKGIDAEHSLIEFTDLNRLPLPDIEKIVRASVVARRERQAAPSQSEILAIDQACVDLVYATPHNHDLVERIESRVGMHQLTAMRELKMGSDRYTLIEV